VKDQDHIG